MIQLTGTDIIETDRIKKAIDKSGAAFINRVFTDKEIEYCEKRGKNKYESYAARFAAKEAVSKALGCGISKNAAMHSIEIQNMPNGKPTVVLYNEALDYYQNVVKGFSIDVSLSHCNDFAIAFVSILAES